MATIEQQSLTAKDRIVLTAISWQMYEALGPG
jgi:hypothetical protein